MTESSATPSPLHGDLAPHLSPPTLASEASRDLGSSPMLYSTSQSQVQTRVLGASRLYRPIEGVFFNPSALPLACLYLGAFHGDEQGSTRLLLRLTTWLKARPEALSGQAVAILPMVNPDGFSAHTRQNALGVDLNRNFPTQNWAHSEPNSPYYGGPFSGSEPETQLLCHLLEVLKPRCIVSVHSPYRIVNFDGPAEGLAQSMAKHNGYPVQADIGYPTPGSFGTYCGLERNIPTLTLELPEDVDDDTLWHDNHQALLSVLS